jgi:hypothetical protein
MCFLRQCESPEVRGISWVGVVDLLSSFATPGLCLHSGGFRPFMQCTYPRMYHSSLDTIEIRKSTANRALLFCKVCQLVRGVVGGCCTISARFKHIDELDKRDNDWFDCFKHYLTKQLLFSFTPLSIR